jgi:hypothetical protein
VVRVRVEATHSGSMGGEAMNAGDTSSLQREGTSMDHPMKKTSKSRWMQKATDKMKAKGTEGSETRLAHAAGESPMGWAREHYHDSGVNGRKARFAVNANK